MNQELDTQDMYSSLQQFPRQIKEGWELAGDLKFTDIDRIIITGMGGSALPGEILKSYLYKEFKIPFEINKNYSFLIPVNFL